MQTMLREIKEAQKERNALLSPFLIVWYLYLPPWAIRTPSHVHVTSLFTEAWVSIPIRLTLYVRLERFCLFILVLFELSDSCIP